MIIRTAIAVAALVASIGVASAQESPQVQAALHSCDQAHSLGHQDVWQECVGKVLDWARKVEAMPKITPSPTPDPPLGDPAMILPSCQALLLLCTPDRPCHQKVVEQITDPDNRGCDLD